MTDPLPDAAGEPAPNAIDDAIDDEIVVATPSSLGVRLLFGALGLFFTAVLITWTPNDLPTLPWQIAYFVTVGTLFLACAVLPLVAAFTGDDVEWRLSPGQLIVARVGPLRRRVTVLTGDDIRDVTVEPEGSRAGPDRLVVRLELIDDKKPLLASPAFDDLDDAEAFAEALCEALDLPPPISLIPPGFPARPPWARKSRRSPFRRPLAADPP
jgi:hypothetical protein